jgi:hypothetical protein
VTDVKQTFDADRFGTPRAKTISRYDPMPTADLGRTLSGRELLEAIPSRQV